MPGKVSNCCVAARDAQPALPMCLGAAAPAAWYGLPEAERATRAVLNADQCIIDDAYFFVLGRIVLPVADNPEPFEWLAWVSVSRDSFDKMGAAWDSAGRERQPPYFGWLQSDLPYDVPTLDMKTSVQTMPVGERPLIALEPTDHPLAVEQRDGITMARVRAIVERALQPS